MRKLVFTLVMLLTLSLNAQNDDVIRFLGIPVDGSKEEMIIKLKQKGYTYDYVNDMFNGEFNGSKITGTIQTYHNKVYAIRFTYDVLPGFSKSVVISKFNSLVNQYDLSDKYISYLRFDKTLHNIESYRIDPNENIGDEMRRGRLYKAQYRYKQGKQLSDTTGLFQYKIEVYKTIHNVATSRGVSVETYNDIDDDAIKAMFIMNKLEQDVVGFFITNGTNPGTFNIVFDYYNRRNAPNGEDL